MNTFYRASVCGLIWLFVFNGDLRAADEASPSGQTPPTVHVSGSGTVKVAADVVFVSITMTAVDDDLLRVRQSSDTTARGALDIAKKNGAVGDDVEISRLDLSLDFNKQLNRQIYQVRRDATVKLTDLSKLDSMLADLLREANLTVVKISFDTSKQKQHEFEALRKAAADARVQAQFLANLHGFRLGKASDIRIDAESDEPFVTSVVPVVGQNEKPISKRLADHTQDAPMVTAAKAGPTIFRLAALDAAQQPAAGGAQPDGGKPFAVGQISLTAKISVDYELIK